MTTIKRPSDSANTTEQSKVDPATVSLSGYEIDRVEELDGNRVVGVADDHGLEIEGNQTREVFFPQRTTKGTNTFIVPRALNWSRE